MCELFAMSCSKPSAVTYSLHEFARHGGLTYANKSGWGIAYFEDRDALVIKEAEPASRQPLGRTSSASRGSPRIASSPMCASPPSGSRRWRTPTLSAALSAATFTSSPTTEPWRGLAERYPPARRERMPVGDTDSELAFMLLLERLRPRLGRWVRGMPDVADRLQGLCRLCRGDERNSGRPTFSTAIATRFLSTPTSESTRRTEASRNHGPPACPYATASPARRARDWGVAGCNVHMGDEQTILFASVPLDESGWEPIPDGTAIAVRRGEEVGRDYRLTSASQREGGRLTPPRAAARRASRGRDPDWARPAGGGSHSTDRRRRCSVRRSRSGAR